MDNKRRRTKEVGVNGMWYYRRMIKIKWTERITNDEALKRAEEKRNQMKL
jgi:hypothetical protein